MVAFFHIWRATVSFELLDSYLTHNNVMPHSYGKNKQIKITQSEPYQLNLQIKDMIASRGKSIKKQRHLHDQNKVSNA